MVQIEKHQDVIHQCYLSNDHTILGIWLMSNHHVVDLHPVCESPKTESKH